MMLAAPRPKPIGEPQKILFVNLVEDCHYGLLNDLILQGCDAQGALPSTLACVPHRLSECRLSWKAALGTSLDGFGYASLPVSHFHVMPSTPGANDSVRYHLSSLPAA